jgi:phenylpropionate dioxygenase-like ring-hydroxylating dioxygenase large terminal subunit
MIRLLCEDLVLFRDGTGQVGLLYPRCIHRGTSLLYGKVELRGIRCPYHGWLYTVEGRCVERACEPLADARNVHLRQPWYPTLERHGLVFAYMGPGPVPLFPHFEIEEDLKPNEMLVSFGQERMTFDGAPAAVLIGAAEYNWWNFHDNVMDPFHLYFLHSQLNGIQLVDSLAQLPVVRFVETVDGVLSIQHRQMPDGRTHQRTAQTLCANMNSVASLSGEPGRGAVGWTVPADDTSFRAFWLARVERDSDPTEWQRELGIFNGWGIDKPFLEWTLEDHQTWQSDYICQTSQGPISLHSEEHLSRTDLGIAMVRRRFREEAKQLQEGGTAVGVTFDEPYLVVSLGGNAILESSSQVCRAGFDGLRHARERKRLRVSTPPETLSPEVR